MEHENWMGALPEAAKNIPIIFLAIPGSHNSMTYAINRKSKVAPDAEVIIRRIYWIFPFFVRRWAITQSVDVVDQLKYGIRYFDLRVCLKDDDKFYYAHGLYSMEIFEPLQEIKKFLDGHPTEVVILDFQHFYELNEDHHRQIQDSLRNIFGDRIYGTEDGELTECSLNSSTRIGKQVLVIYRRCPIPLPKEFWPSYYWPTPWPNVCSIKKLKAFLSDSLELRQPTAGYVSQCILTPSPRYISLRFLSSLKSTAKKVDKNLCDWIQSQHPGEFGISDDPSVNIFIADFIHLKNGQFCKWVIDLNSTLDAGNETCECAS